MNDETFPPEEARTCECGALLEEGATQCRKCRAWARWMRRQTARRRAEERKATRRPRRTSGTRRPAGRPRDIAEAGVIGA